MRGPNHSLALRARISPVVLESVWSSITRVLLEICETNMTVDFPPTTDELLETFDDLPDWDERYDFLIDLGRELPKLAAEFCTPENKVDGCLSTVWLVTRNENGRMQIQADSDSIIVKGLIVVLLSLFHDQPAQKVIETEPQAFFKQLGLEQHLSHGRRNGLYSMVERIRQLAVEMIAAS